NIQLKSGTNSFHGSMFEFVRNDSLDARGYFRPQPLPKDELKRHNFGGLLSGPIKRDKTFFLAGYEGQRFKIEVPGTNIVMTPEMRRGDFSGIAARITDPFTGAQFPGNMIPASRLSPVAVNLVNSRMPLPNQAGSVNYAGGASEIADQDQEFVRLDHRLSAND